MTILNCQNMSIKPNSGRGRAPLSLLTQRPPRLDVDRPLLTSAGWRVFSQTQTLRRLYFEKLAEMPLSVGFSCRKQQNCDLNLESDERIWTGTPDISQIGGPVGFIVLLTQFITSTLQIFHTILFWFWIPWFSNPRALRGSATDNDKTCYLRKHLSANLYRLKVVLHRLNGIAESLRRFTAIRLS